MGLEITTYIDGLVATNPLDSDSKSQGAAHLRLTKSALKATFPGVTGAVTPTHTELNFVDGVTSPIQTQLDAEALTRGNADTAEALARTAADDAEILARTNADALLAPKASPTFTGTVTLPATGAGATEAVRKDYADALSFAAALPAQAGNAGKVPTTDGTAASWTSLKTLNGESLIGATDIALLAGPQLRRAFFDASGSHVIPAGVASIRGYVFGAGAAGTTTQSGAGGGCAYGDIAVVAGDTVTVTIASGVATITTASIDRLTGNAASGLTAGTASKHASVTQAGAYSGGAGTASAGKGGASSGSPLGAGVAGSGVGGSGWGGASSATSGGGGGGVGGVAVTNLYSGPGLPHFSVITEPILAGLTGPSTSITSTAYGQSGAPGAGGGGSSATGSTGGAGGFGGGGGNGASGAGGAGGFGGGGAATVTSSFTAGAGGHGGGGGGGNGAGTVGGAGGGAAAFIYY